MPSSRSFFNEINICNLPLLSLNFHRVHLVCLTSLIEFLQYISVNLIAADYERSTLYSNQSSVKSEHKSIIDSNMGCYLS